MNESWAETVLSVTSDKQRRIQSETVVIQKTDHRSFWKSVDKDYSYTRISHLSHKHVYRCKVHFSVRCRRESREKTQPTDIITETDVVSETKELLLQVRIAVLFRLNFCSYEGPILHTFWWWIVDQWVWSIRWKMCFSVFNSFEEDRLQLNEVNSLNSWDIHWGLLSKTVFVSCLLEEELTGLSNVTTESGLWLVH